MERTTSDQVRLTDLAGIGFILATFLILSLLEFTRRRICSIQNLAFILSAVSCTFIIGGLIDHIVTDEQLEFSVYGVRRLSSRSSFTSYIFIPVAVAVASTGMLVQNIWFCSCNCCCLVGARSKSHRSCRAARFNGVIQGYAVAFIMLFGCIGARLNARLRNSSIHPEGGTLHWHVLKCPSLLSITHVATVSVLLLKSLLKHTRDSEDQIAPPNFGNLSSTATKLTTSTSDMTRLAHRQTEQLVQATAQIQAQAQTISHLHSQNVMQKVELDKKNKSAVVNGKATESRLAQSLETVLRKTHTQRLNGSLRPTLMSTPSSKSMASSSSSYHQPPSPTIHSSPRRRARKINQPLEPLGDVSAFISDDSDDGEGAQRHRSRGTMLTPEPLPFVLAQRLHHPSNRLIYQPNDVAASISSDSDSDSDGGSARSMAYQQPLLSNTYPLSTDLQWIECLDESTKSVYYYCEATGESSWDLPVYNFYQHPSHQHHAKRE